MKKTKLIQLFLRLDVSELKDFGSYLRWKAFKPTGGVFLLYKYLKKSHPEFPDNRVTKEALNKAIFKNSKSSSRIYDVMSQLNTALENYLITKNIESNSSKSGLIFLDILQDRKLDSIFFLKVDQLKKEFANNKQNGLVNLYHIYNLNLMHHSHPNYLATKEKELDFMDVSKSLDDFFIASKLHHYCIFDLGLQLDIQAQSKINPLLKETVLKICQNNEYNSIPHINLLSQLHRASLGDNFEDFQTLKIKFFEKVHHFNTSEIYDIYNIFINMFYKFYLRGLKDALKDILEMYKFGLENELLFEFGYINDNLFSSIVQISCGVGELNWTDKFIEDYGQYLNEKERADCVLYCQSLVSFERNDFDNVLRNLSTVKFKNPIQICSTKILLLQCYYELEDFEDLFENLAKAFSIFLKRNDKLLDEMKKPYINFVNIIKKLYNIKSTFNSNKLINQLKKMPELNISNAAKKQWLEKKIISLKKEYLLD